MKKSAMTPYLKHKMQKSQGMVFGVGRRYEGRADGMYVPRPKSLRQSTVKQIHAAAKRFASDGDIRNAVGLLLLAHPEANIKFRRATGGNRIDG